MEGPGNMAAAVLKHDMWLCVTRIDVIASKVYCMNTMYCRGYVAKESATIE